MAHALYSYPACNSSYMNDLMCLVDQKLEQENELLRRHHNIIPNISPLFLAFSSINSFLYNLL